MQWHLNCSLPDFTLRVMEADACRVQAEMALFQLANQLDSAAAAVGVRSGVCKACCMAGCLA